MTIYPLPPAELDDKTLETQIKAIAQVLCNVHHKPIAGLINQSIFDKRTKLELFEQAKLIPLRETSLDLTNAYVTWALECRANYNELVKMGLACCDEYTWRSSAPYCIGDTIFAKNKTFYKYRSVIEWARDNVPELPEKFVKPLQETLKEGYVDLGIDIPSTPFPLVMPDEYIVGYDLPRDPNYERMKFTIESYRDYYKARLQKVREVKCKECNGTGYNDSIEEYSLRCGLCDYGVIRQTPEPTWTRRTKPDWL
jgi:hypothetical protein